MPTANEKAQKCGELAENNAFWRGSRHSHPIRLVDLKLLPIWCGRVDSELHCRLFHIRVHADCIDRHAILVGSDSMLPFARAIPWRHPPDPGTLIPPNELANLRRIATRVFHVFIKKLMF